MVVGDDGTAPTLGGMAPGHARWPDIGWRISDNRRRRGSLAAIPDGLFISGTTTMPRRYP
jgi:hypothetical protein